DVLDLTSVEYAPAPTWAVEIVRGAAAKTDARSSHPSPGDADDEPPVRLGDQALAAWRGEIVVSKEHEVVRRTDGIDVDRSDTLFLIGKDLAHAGASRRTIVAALAERDEALDFKKYTDRPGGGQAEYARIADKVLAPGPECPPVLVHGSGLQDEGKAAGATE